MPDPSAPVSRIVWHELATTDRDRSVAFLEALLGWTVRDEPAGDAGGAIVLELDGNAVGGLAEGAPPAGGVSQWRVHVHVEDVDAVAARVPRLGGTVAVAPCDVPGSGRLTELIDPQGARFAAVTRAAGPPPEPAALPATHTFCWNELLTTDVHRALAFYGKLLGWGGFEFPETDGGHHAILRRGDRDEAGLMQMPPGSDHPPFWLPYVAVENVERCVARIAGLGGSIVVDTTVIPGVGRFAVAAEPTGAAFAVFRSGATARPTGTCGVAGGGSRP
ncbi:MAG: VOC family protein [Candidatus Eiseniibacteriota bacterium]|jgi:predicted enzyme related to lactoylglutathione lyase